MLTLGNVLGVKHDTLMGLSGLGDLVLTATDNQSRNKRFGVYIGEGLDIKTALDKVGQHVASYSTTKLIYNLVQEYNLDLPLTEQAYKVLFEGLEIKQAILNLSVRPQKSE
jgi:glycerol-3-phosphate dehydrogenase (NAD(P)+)